MMIYRSLVVGLLGAITLLLAEQGTLLERAARPARPAPVVAAPPPWRSPLPGVDDAGPTLIVHISKRGAGDDPRAALGLTSSERLLAIDDRPVATTIATAALRARWHAARPGSYFELALQGEPPDDVARRLLVLVMP
jgi:hypothetical protein